MKWSYFLAVVYFVGQINFVYGQKTEEFDRLDSDRIFLLAQRLEQKSERKKSRAMCYMALNKDPRNQDIRLFLAESYLRDDLYEFARQEILHVLSIQPGKLEAYLLGAQLEQQLGNFEKAVEFCDMGLKQKNIYQELLFLKAESQIELGQKKEAAQTLKTLLHINPNHDQADVMHAQLTHIEYLKHFSVAYHYNQFDVFYDDAHFVSIEGMQKIKRGRLVERVNLTKRGEEMGWQAMIDAYPNIFKHTYGLIRVGVGSRNVFPQLTLGGEVFQDIHKIALDASVGLRHMRFDTSAYTLFTASTVKRFNKLHIGARGYITPLVIGFNWRANGHLALYFRDNHFVWLEYGYGADPDNMVDTARDFLLVDTQRAGLIYQIPLGQRLMLRATARYTMANKQLPDPINNINRWDFGLKMIFRLHKFEGIYPQIYANGSEDGFVDDKVKQKNDQIEE